MVEKETEKKKLPNIKDLIDFGFKEWGYWKINEDQKPVSELIDEILVTIKKTIYAFATDEVVGYIGVAGDLLTSRLRNRYSSLVKSQIRSNLDREKKVSILYFQPEKLLYKELEVDMIRGLEIPLQVKFKTQWTTKGYGGIGRAIDEIIESMLT